MCRGRQAALGRLCRAATCVRIVDPIRGARQVVDESTRIEGCSARGFGDARVGSVEKSAMLGVELPPTAAMLRELLNLGQIIQSHSLHFFFCAMPDFLGQEQSAAERGVFGMLKMYVFHDVIIASGEFTANPDGQFQN